jgi:hypothetical protein
VDDLDPRIGVIDTTISQVHHDLLWLTRCLFRKRSAPTLLALPGMC